MLRVSSNVRSPEIENEGSALHHGAKNCTIFSGDQIYIIVAKAIWPHKTAENWAAAAGKKPRVAKLWLAGTVSDSGKLAIQNQFK